MTRNSPIVHDTVAFTDGPPSPAADSSFQAKDIVTPHQHDVLCGRGGGTNNHVGNELFRQMVNQKKCLYLHSSKRDKPSVSKSIVHSIRGLNPPGRFLQRDEQTGLWYDIGDQKAREKTSQALREGAPEIRKTLTPGSTSGSHSVSDAQLQSFEQFSQLPSVSSQPESTWSSSNKQLMSSHPSSFSPSRVHASQEASSFRRFPDFPVSLPSHLGGSSEPAQAIYQFLKAQQLQHAKEAATDDVEHSTKEQHSAISVAATSSFRPSNASAGTKKSLVQSELEQQTQINSNRASSFATQIAAAAGISPSAASIALQLAARAGEYSAMEEERERLRAASRRERDQEYYSHQRARTTSTIEYAPSTTSSITAPLKSSQWQEFRPRMGAASSIPSPDIGLTASREIQASSTLSFPNEVHNRLAIAEQLAQLSYRIGEVSKMESCSGDDLQSVELPAVPPRTKDELAVLHRRSELFQDLGLMGVTVEEIQNAVSNNASLEELLRNAQDRSRCSNGVRTSKIAEVAEDVQGAISTTYKSTNTNLDEAKKECGARTVSGEIEMKIDSIFPHDMIQSALNAMGVQLAAA